jgi:hypothetical protein
MYNNNRSYRPSQYVSHQWNNSSAGNGYGQNRNKILSDPNVVIHGSGELPSPVNYGTALPASSQQAPNAFYHLNPSQLPSIRDSRDPYASFFYDDQSNLGNQVTGGSTLSSVGIPRPGMAHNGSSNANGYFPASSSGTRSSRSMAEATVAPTWPLGRNTNQGSSPTEGSIRRTSNHMLESRGRGYGDGDSSTTAFPLIQDEYRGSPAVAEIPMGFSSST